MVRKKYPDHNILGEEGKYAKTNSTYTWIIDPLDGTNNFAHGIPIFCVSIAVERNGEVLLGVVYDSSRKEMFMAEKGKGAFLNGKKISVSRRSELRDCMLATGFYYDRGKNLVETLDQIREFYQTGIIEIRRLGSAALDLCYVACGRYDGFWEFTLNPWDFAAGKLIVEEAGGKVTDRDGNDPGIRKSYIVSSNGRVHGKMMDILH